MALPRLALGLLLALAPAWAEFLRFEIAFEDTGCVSCLESLEGRLGRVRGVTKVEVAEGAVTLQLEEGNRVRLNPLLGRITQDGTKITRLRVRVRGTVDGGVLAVAGQDQTLAIESSSSIEPGERVLEGRLEPGDRPRLTIEP